VLGEKSNDEKIRAANESRCRVCNAVSRGNHNSYLIYRMRASRIRERARKIGEALPVLSGQFLRVDQDSFRVRIGQKRRRRAYGSGEDIAAFTECSHDFRMVSTSLKRCHHRQPILRVMLRSCQAHRPKGDCIERYPDVGYRAEPSGAGKNTGRIDDAPNISGRARSRGNMKASRHHKTRCRDAASQ